MSVDYVSLRKENERRYGTDIGRIGGMLLANRYDKRTHFIFELLQNAEDALRRREGWAGLRSVSFDLSAKELRISHYGQAFDDDDVRGVCGIDESTKDITSIGRFGIGFKSVYAFTDRPEIHSGAEAFAIEKYVWPVAVPPRTRKPDETVIHLPLEENDRAGHDEITQGLEHLGARALLFLRHVKEISWTVQDGPSGLYFRDDPNWLDSHVRELALMGEQQGKPEIEERWLVFSREIENEGKSVGHVEIAFALSVSGADGRPAMQPLAESPLVVFFPTVLPTHVGFLIQGPYRTTPSRDNVPPNDPWNQHLVQETGELLLDALRWLSARQMLDIGTLQCLPLERTKFADGLLAPLFDNVAGALKTEALLPCSGRGYAPAANARLSRTQDLRDLFEPSQLAPVLGANSALTWLSGEITADRTPALRQYLIRELGVSELTAESLLPRLSKSFLEEQPDDWIVRLYEFLSSVPAIIPRLNNVPLVRLEDGSHVPAFTDGQPQAFLPGDAETGFPTVRRAVCFQVQSRKFLQSLRLTEPDLVDDVIRNLLPKYLAGTAGREGYAADIARILRAYATDSTMQKEKLISSLKSASFVMATDLGDGSSHIEKSENVYLAAERLKELFSDIAGIRIVDDSYDCLRGEDVRELLEACGATRYIYPIATASNLPPDEKLQLRRDGGCESVTYDWPIQDYMLRGLDELLKQLRTLDRASRANKAGMLWEALIELQDRRPGVFSARYSWMYFQQRSVSFDSLFIRQLNEAAWCPGADGELQQPSFVLFESLGWRASPFLGAKIRFKNPIVEELAREAGFEPEVLDMLKKLGLTSMTELMARLRVDKADDASSTEPTEPGAGDDAAAAGSDDQDSADDNADDDAQIDVGTGEHDLPGQKLNEDDRRDSTDENETGELGQTPERAGGGGGGGGQTSTTRAARKSPERRFVSYVAALPEDEEGEDPDGLSHADRMALETLAVELIRRREPVLQVMPPGNTGFDLLESDTNGDPERWIEVKAMTGSLQDRPVGLSSVQFEFARRHGEQYWLYVVEHANDPARSRIVKIHNPAGRAGTFTFDHGWIEIADIDDILEKAS